KSLPVVRHAVLIHPGAVGMEMQAGDEELLRTTELRRVAADGNGHQRSVGGDIEQLPAVPPPLWQKTALVRDLPFAAGVGKTANVDLMLPGLVGCIGDPAGALVGRHWREARAAGALKQRMRLVRCH